MRPINLQVGDIVQIDPAHDEVFGGCFMQVTEPKSWGAQGFVVALPTKHTKFGRAYYRCKFENMEWVGRAVWVSE